jgi:predicted alpha-1,6-mannanase (GH76 family)
MVVQLELMSVMGGVRRERGEWKWEEKRVTKVPSWLESWGGTWSWRRRAMTATELGLPSNEIAARAGEIAKPKVVS